MKSKQSAAKPASVTKSTKAAKPAKSAKPTIEAGQVWQMDGVKCYIGQVGKTLVNYKLLKGDAVRGPSSLGNKEVLLKHLKSKKAVLVRTQAA